jgi:undecaprenyl pyrophosphate phosphatase UppP
MTFEPESVISLWTVIALAWVHFFADFILQTNKMATNKSKSNAWLLFHVAVYTVPFLFFGVTFALINGAAHFCVDWVTSRINSRLYQQGKVHWFFVGVGADQAIHLTTLVATAYLLL